MTSYITHETSIDGPNYEIWSAIFSKAGSAREELEITRSLCELRDVKRLEESVGYIVGYAREIAKAYRELQARNMVPAEPAVAP